MALIVQKYGGTSVGSVERIASVAERFENGQSWKLCCSGGFSNGQTTDQLVKLAHQISTNPSRREMDMLLSTGEQVSIALSMALQELGQPAISLTGAGGNCHRGRTLPRSDSAYPPNGFHGTSRMVK